MNRYGSFKRDFNLHQICIKPVIMIVRTPCHVSDHFFLVIHKISKQDTNTIL